MRKEKKIEGLLSPDFDWDALTVEEKERIYFKAALAPEAYAEIVRLRSIEEKLMAIAIAYEKILQALPPVAKGKRLGAVERERAKLGNTLRAAKFETQIGEYVAGLKPGMKATTIADLVYQAIEMDTAEIREAKARGDHWQSVDLRYERKNQKGDGYSRAYALEIIRELRK